MRVLLSFLLTLGLMFIFTETTFAMRLEPDSQDLSVTPGEVASAQIIVSNDQGSKRTYRVRFSEVTFGERAEDLSFSTIAANESGWFTAIPTEFSLNPEESQTIEISIAIPTDLKSTAKTLAILVEEVHEGEGIIVVPSTASMLFLHIGEDLAAAIRLINFAGLPEAVIGSKQADFTAVFYNDGNDTAAVIAEVSVKNIFGREVDRFPLAEAPKRVPPLTYKSLAFSWPKEGGFRPLAIGEHRFDIVQGDRVIASTSVTFLPVAFITTAALLILAFILGILMFVRSRR